MEHKTTQAAVKSIEDRTVIGIATVFGVVDSYNDRSHPGSFADTKINGRDRIRFLWQHDESHPPIATINYVREVSAAELPAKVIALAPEATGGVEVSRTYLNSQRANEVLEGIKAGAIEEMSYAYEVKPGGFKMTEEEGQRPIRELLGIRLYDISDVTHGAVPFTFASKVWTGNSLTFIEHSDAVVTAIEEFAQRVKDRRDFRQSEGRDLSAANRERIIALAEGLKAATLDLEELLKATQPKPDPALTRALFIEYQRIAAQLNGVTYAN